MQNQVYNQTLSPASLRLYPFISYATAMKCMKCMICGHLYDPALGDEGVQPGTDWKDIPDDWCCPICLATKDQFISV